MNHNEEQYINSHTPDSTRPAGKERTPEELCIELHIQSLKSEVLAGRVSILMLKDALEGIMQTEGGEPQDNNPDSFAAWRMADTALEAARALLSLHPEKNSEGQGQEDRSSALDDAVSALGQAMNNQEALNEQFEVHTIECPLCQAEHQIGHMDWTALECENCGVMVAKKDWKEVK